MVKIGKAQSELKSYQQKMWEAMSAAEKWTIRDIYYAAKSNELKTVNEYAMRLVKAGYVEQVGMKDKTKVYKVIKKARYAPAIRRDGTETKTANKNQRMWKVMQMQKQFTYLDVAKYSGANETTAKSYVSALKRAGYLRVLSEHSHDSKSINTKAIYSLKIDRNTGPLSPQIKRIRVVQDANTGDVFDIRGGANE